MIAVIFEFAWLFIQAFRKLQEQLDLDYEYQHHCAAQFLANSCSHINMPPAIRSICINLYVCSVNSIEVPHSKTDRGIPPDLQ